MKKILDELKKYKDDKFASFQAKLMPTVDKKSMIGVRTPDLKTLAKEIANILNTSAVTVKGSNANNSKKKEKRKNQGVL